MDRTRGRVDAVVVGGSLTGLSASLALARDGNRSVVLEHAVGAVAGGSGIGLEPGIFEEVTGIPVQSVPVVRGNRLSAAWEQVRAVLLDAAHRQPLIEVREGVAVKSVLGPSDGQISVLTDSGVVTGDVLIGADGGRSVVRRYVAPQQPLARYAGYVIWRALLDERDVPGGVEGRGNVMEFFSTASARLTIYCVPGADGSTRIGERRISFAWYDAGRNRLMQQTGCVTEDGYVVGTLYQVRMQPDLIAELGDLAERMWPSPWRHAIRTAIRTGRLFATPIAEYVPSRLARDRAVIIGDAAHLASPVVGAGFKTGLLDVESVARRLRETPDDVPHALLSVEADRLRPAQRMVQSGMGVAASLDAA